MEYKVLTTDQHLDLIDSHITEKIGYVLSEDITIPKSFKAFESFSFLLKNNEMKKQKEPVYNDCYIDDVIFVDEVIALINDWSHFFKDNKHGIYIVYQDNKLWVSNQSRRLFLHIKNRNKYGL